MKSKKRGIFSVVALSIIIFTIVNTKSVFATGSTDFNVQLNSSLEVNLADIDFEITPNGLLNTGNTTINVASNNVTGFTTQITTDKDSTEENPTALVRDGDGGDAMILMLDGPYTASNFPMNHWGISLDGENFLNVTTKDGTPDKINPLSPNRAKVATADFYVGAKVDQSIPAGSYTNSLLVTVIPNYVPPRNCGDYRKMQDIETIMETMTEGEQIQLCDERDYKIYWVAKLKDGNVWMTQNLDYDIKATDNVVTNIDGTSTTWNTDATYAPHATSAELINNTDINGTYSYDPGNKYITNGTGEIANTICTASSNGGEKCHYHLGNYYQWNAATAGTGSVVTDSNATGSVCPKGWRLPTSGNYTDDYSFGKLTNAYGITNSTDGESDTTKLVDPLLVSPLFYARGGAVQGAVYSQGGQQGFYWSSRKSNDNRAFYLDFNSSRLIPNSKQTADYGFSVRCVAVKPVSTVTINVDNSTYGSVSQSSVTIKNGTTFTANANVLTFSDGTRITATPANLADYIINFNSWSPASGTITENTTITASFSGALKCAGMNKMQDIGNLAASFTLENQTQLCDARDGKVYWVAKLADGNIWMTQNLDYGDGDWGWYDYYTNDGGDLYADDYYLPNGTGDPTRTVSLTNPTALGNTDLHYHIGEAYRWVDVVDFDWGEDERFIGQENLSSSICPSGWKLPTTSGNTTTFDGLVTHYGQNLTSAPFYLTLSGAAESYQGWDWQGGEPGNMAALLTSTRNTDYCDSYAEVCPTISDGSYPVIMGSSATFRRDGSYRVNNQHPSHNTGAVRCVATTSLNSISTMQEMTPTVVAATPENTSKQLIDTRDNKTYWVTKLADGNIWMTQNLDYDIKATGNIISNNDGTTGTWSPNTATTTTIFSNSSSTGTYSYDPGNYYWNGTTWLSSNNNTQGYSASALSTAFSTTAPADGGTHYHVGNLYQYNAATAGTGGTITSKDATSSICPKGWRLPTSNSTTANYSFGKLKNAYNATTGTALAASPLRFVPAGDLSSGRLYYAGYFGDYWSSMASSVSSGAYNLNFYSGHIGPSNDSYRCNGFPVRCVSI